MLATSLQQVHPFRLYLDLIIEFNTWSGGWICRKDVPVTSGDCSRLHNMIPVGIDRMAALRRMEEVVDCRLELLQQHCLHRFCPVRATLSRLESNLECARQLLRDIMDRILEVPNGAIVEEDAERG